MSIGALSREVARVLHLTEKRRSSHLVRPELGVADTRSLNSVGTPAASDLYFASLSGR